MGLFICFAVVVVFWNFQRQLCSWVPQSYETMDSNSGKHDFWNTFWCSPSIQPFATWMSFWLPWVNFSCLDNSFSWKLFHRLHLLRFTRMRSFIIVISQHCSFWYKQSSSHQSPEYLHINSGKVMLIPEKFLILQRSSEKTVLFVCLFFNFNSVCIVSNEETKMPKRRRREKDHRKFSFLCRKDFFSTVPLVELEDQESFHLHDGKWQVERGALCFTPACGEALSIYRGQREGEPEIWCFSFVISCRVGML